MRQSEQEKKNKRIAAMTTAGINALVLLFLLFVVAWRAPNPPLPEYGIELNFGTDNQGSGEVQPQEPVGTPETVEEELEQSQPEEAETTPEPEEVAEVAPEPEAEAPQQQVVSKVESPVTVKEEKKETVKPVEKPAEKPAEQKVEKKVETPPKEDPKPLAVFKPNATKSESTSDRSGTPGNHGDDAAAAGDKGNPEGNRDAKALYGKSGGGGGGSSIRLDGFKWPPIKEPSDLPNNSNGIYEFEVKVGPDGTIEGIRPLRKGPSAAAERIFFELISKIEFTPTGSNLPDQSKGVITFTVTSK